MVNPHGITLRASPELPDDMRFLANLGYDALELSPDAFNLLFCGRLHRPIVRELLPVLQGAPFRYSIHSPATMDLRDVGDLDLQMEMAFSVVEFCRMLDARVLVVHFEQKSPDPQVEAVFEDSVRRLADHAQTQDVQIGIENIEVERMAPVLDFVRRLNHPNVGLVFDAGHAFLSARYFGFDYLEAVTASKPLMIHLHVTDNFGRFNPLRLENFTLYRTQIPRDIIPVGKGDLHLPVGWGAIPLVETFALLRGFRGTVITEYPYNMFRGHAKGLADDLRALVRRLAPDEGPAR